MTGSWIAESTRYAIYHRDGFACVYCRSTQASGAQLTLDHVVPRGRRGSNAAANLVTCCMACNALRADRSLKAWATFLRALGVPARVVRAIPRRVAAQTAKPIDRAAGRQLAALARNAQWGFSRYVK